MDISEFEATLSELGLSLAEAATFLSVSLRTAQRWAEHPEDIPGPAQVALRAWRSLHRQNMVWMPKAEAFGDINPDELANQIALHRQHSVDLDATLKRVAARGGPKLQWAVDLQNSRATLGAITVSFYKLKGGSFSPSSYGRNDGQHDMQRDWPLIEDAFSCIAQALGANDTAQPPRR